MYQIPAVIGKLGVAHLGTKMAHENFSHSTANFCYKEKYLQGKYLGVCCYLNDNFFEKQSIC